MDRKPLRVPFAALLVLLTILAFGVAARVVRLDRQIVFDDEIWTRLRVAGVSDRALGQLFDDRVHTVAEWNDRYQSVGRGGDALASIIGSLSADEPQWPPLFYLLCAGWERIVGSGMASLRALAAIFGILAIPAVFAFARELTSSTRVGVIAAALVAISPLDVAYSREARGYSVMLFLLALSSLLLLRALRTGSPRLWIAYAVALFLGLYDFALFGGVAVGHALWVLRAREKHPEAPRAFALAVAPVVALWVPWLARVVLERGHMAATMPSAGGLPFWSFVVPKWIYNLALPFFAADFWVVELGVLALPIVALLVVAVASTWRAERERLIALILLALPTVLVLALADMYWEKSTILIARYQFPLLLAVQLVVAIALARWLLAPRRSVRRAAVAVAAGLAVCGVVSSILVVSQRYWWETWYDAGVPAAVDAINAGPVPLVVSERTSYPSIIMSNDLRPDTRLLLLASDPGRPCRAVVVETGGRDAFLFARPPSLAVQPREQRDATLTPVVVSEGHASLAWRFAALTASLTGHHRTGTPKPWEGLVLWRITTKRPTIDLTVCR
ncbi:MAG TPA: glycosyltransferase family 39 protein [Candidatus Limnocylindria bacterium]|nr:glycosyltransferase family 39 protein [Candidatus Limnocylindria bacterium]